MITNQGLNSTTCERKIKPTNTILYAFS